MSDKIKRHNPNQFWHGETNIGRNTKIIFRHVALIVNAEEGDSVVVYVSGTHLVISEESNIQRFISAFTDWAIELQT